MPAQSARICCSYDLNGRIAANYLALLFLQMAYIRDFELCLVTPTAVEQLAAYYNHAELNLGRPLFAVQLKAHRGIQANRDKELDGHKIPKEAACPR
jgi:hypothetical protein